MRWKREMMSWMYLDSYLHLHGNRELRLENCRRVLECRDVRVCLETRDLMIEIWGTDLRVFDFHDNSVIVRGTLSSLSLHERR
jgi:hypothetical protein